MIKELKTKHREIARLHFEGVSSADIANRLDLNIKTIYTILKDPLCKAFISGLQDKADANAINVRKTLSKMNLSALNVMKDILDPNIEGVPYSVRADIAKNVLDRTGHKAVEKSENISLYFTGQDILEMQKRQEELRGCRTLN